jgi:hypothetical protein
MRQSLQVAVGGTSRVRLVVALFLTLSLAACSGAEESAQPETGTSAPETSAAPTTAEPAVEPLSAEEKAWLAKMKKVRPRIDAMFQDNSTLTQGRMRAVIKNLRSCARALKAGDDVSERFSEAVALFQRGCEKYTAAAKNYAIVLSVSEPGGGVIVGSPEEKVFGAALDKALTAQGSGSSLMSRGEEKADQLRMEIEAASGR